MKDDEYDHATDHSSNNTTDKWFTGIQMHGSTALKLLYENTKTRTQDIDDEDSPTSYPIFSKDTSPAT